MQQGYSSNWHSRLKALGPGVLLATAAIGGSHIVASTQAGALFGWQLADGIKRFEAGNTMLQRVVWHRCFFPHYFLKGIYNTQMILNLE